MMASLRTLVVEIIRRPKPNNIVAQLEMFQDDFEQLIAVLYPKEIELGKTV